MSRDRMKTRRGITLVELMITVALIGIMASSMGGITRHQQLAGFSELQQERAAVLLSWHADRLSAGQPLDPATLARLTASLPDAAVAAERTGNLTTLTVTWRDPLRGPSVRTLTVFVP